MKTHAILDYSDKTQNPVSVVWWWLQDNRLFRMTNMQGSAYYYVPSGWQCILDHLFSLGLVAEFGGSQDIIIKSR